MKKIATKIFLVFFVLLVSSIGVFAQKVERIDFAKAGANSLVWEQKVKANSSKEFVFSAKKGQLLLLNFIDDTKEGTVDIGKATVIEPGSDGNYETTIEVTKDYLLTVSNNTNKATSFRISISLENPKKAVAPQKPNPQKVNNAKEIVKFARGESSAALTRTIAANGTLDFSINAMKGQKIDFTIGYDFKDSDVKGFLTEPGLQDISLTAAPKAPYVFTVKKAGNHRLTINNTTAKKITITLYVGIE
jgi:hypothetical protein